MCFWLVCCILVLFPSHSSACKAACYPPANLQAELSDASIYQLNNSTTLEQSVLAGQCFALCLKKVRHIICVVLILPYFNFYICSTKTSSGHRYVHHFTILLLQFSPDLISQSAVSHIQANDPPHINTVVMQYFLQEFYQPSGQWLSISYDSLSQDCTAFQKVYIRCI